MTFRAQRRDTWWCGDQVETDSQRITTTLAKVQSGTAEDLLDFREQQRTSSIRAGSESMHSPAPPSDRSWGRCSGEVIESAFHSLLVAYPRRSPGIVSFCYYAASSQLLIRQQHGGLPKDRRSTRPALARHLFWHQLRRAGVAVCRSPSARVSALTRLFPQLVFGRKTWPEALKKVCDIRHPAREA